MDKSENIQQEEQRHEVFEDSHLMMLISILVLLSLQWYQSNCTC